MNLFLEDASDSNDIKNLQITIACEDD